jgi:hypothetical protein
MELRVLGFGRGGNSTLCYVAGSLVLTDTDSPKYIQEGRTMLEKIAAVKNPLTVIAIFAGIAEVSGTVVLPFISSQNQLLFIYFLVLFPAFLVALFFLTLNLNSAVLYAPSDFQNEENYMKVMRYNNTELKLEEVRVTVGEQIAAMTKELHSLTMEHDIAKEANIAGKDSAGIASSVISDSRFLCQVSFLYRSEEFTEKVRALRYRAEIYGNRKNYSDNASHAAIWLGRHVGIQEIRDIMPIALAYYRHLRYVHISGDLGDNDTPEEIYHHLYIGGSTDSATKMFNLSEFSYAEVSALFQLPTMEEINKAVRSKYPG